MSSKANPFRGLALLAVTTTGLFLAACATTSREGGFVSLFDGKTLNGWRLLNAKGAGYGVTNGVLFCARGGGGNLLTERQYSDFILRCEFKLEPGSNNGIGIRTPMEGGSLAYTGMELQVLDDSHPKYANLQPGQYHGSIYLIAPARRGALRPVGEWNEQEITARGRRITVKLNGKVIVDKDLNTVTDPEILQKHPGILREKGHIGFLGHNEYVEFRNIRVKELPVAKLNNLAPAGFNLLFNGANLAGWKGLVGTPLTRAKMSKDQLASAQAKADEQMHAHWGVANGMLVFDGKGQNLCTARDYADFEMLVDWKIEPLGDSGLYLRGSPQVQIWDREDRKGNPKRLGSGGLYNNQKNPSVPLKFADHFVGDWNTFRILMVGEKVHIFLNGELVVNNTTLENYWDRNQPIFPTGTIELQNHGNLLFFRNLYVREINAKPSAPAAATPPAAKRTPAARSGSKAPAKSGDGWVPADSAPKTQAAPKSR